ncbi:MAG: hypothetical protein H7282_04830 [Cytophagaceae bacterium]|nr:hypothetical protein [Cytophagaceae bacterium]
MPLKQITWKNTDDTHHCFCGDRWVGQVLIGLPSNGYDYYCELTSKRGHTQNVADAMKAVEQSLKELSTQIFTDGK